MHRNRSRPRNLEFICASRINPRAAFRQVYHSATRQGVWLSSSSRLTLLPVSLERLTYGAPPLLGTTRQSPRMGPNNKARGTAMPRQRRAPPRVGRTMNPKPQPGRNKRKRVERYQPMSWNQSNPRVHPTRIPLNSIQPSERFVLVG